MAERQPATSSDEVEQKLDKGVALSCKVSQAFKKRFKIFAVVQGISMTDFLKDGFALSQKKQLK